MTCAKTLWDYPVIVTIFQISAEHSFTMHQAASPKALRSDSAGTTGLSITVRTPQRKTQSEPLLLPSLTWLCVCVCVWSDHLPMQIRFVSSLYEVMKNYPGPERFFFFLTPL